MIYTLEQGPREQRILDQCKRHKQPIPDFIQNAPDLMTGLEMYYVAFLDLSGSRQGNQIPWREVNHYCKEKSYTDTQTEAMHYILTCLDAARAEYYANKDGE